METEEGMAYTINGVKLVFPCKAYPTQLCMMDKIIKGVERQQNSLLESPTGSGKSLALLCSCLAWQTAEYEKKAKLEKKMNKEVLDSGCCSTPSGIGNEHPLPTGPVSMDKDKQTTDAKVDQNNHVETITIDQEEPQDKEACSTPIQTSVLNQSKSPTDDDFQPLKKRFRTPSNQQAATKSVKRRRVQGTSPGDDKDYEPPEWTMELTADSTKDSVSPAMSDDLGKKEKCSPDGGVKAENIKVPTIFFGTRTHKQIAQITRELGKTVYKKTRMSILSSREHSCVHPIVSKGRNKNEECKKLLDGTEGRTCRYKLKVDTIGTQFNIRYQGLASAWDIEDLVSLGNRVKACPYYASRDLMREADIVFCPYNYLIDPKIRRQMEIDLTDQIVVLDEAHNVEDSARDSASFTINAVELQELLDDIDKMVSLQVMMEQHRSLHLLVGNLLRWIHDSSGTLKERGFEQSSKVWSGMEIVAALEKQGITPGTFIIHWKHFEFVLKSLKDPNREMHSPSLSSQSLSRLEGIFLVAQFMLGNEMKYISDYRVAIMKTATMVRNEGLQRGGWRRSHGGMRKEWTHSLNFWCLNPAVVFSEIGSVARCIILTSGTLSPMTSFSSELGIKFPIQLEANHVIANSQVWVGTLSTGPNGSAINASYHSAETFTFQDEVGRMVLSVCETVPHGVLCFFPSYSMLDKLSKRWQATGLWSQLMEKKDIVSEPRSGDKSEFDDIMHQFYHAVRVSAGEGGDEEDSEDESSVDGGLFLAVCRGKVSEGLDFADNNARAVITVGIPFPNFKDVQLELKRKYNNQYSSSRGLLNGSEWYEIQAYRALNQALGRCIRHKQDWGAILLIDERFNKSPKYINGISKWVRHRIQRFHDFGLAMASLKQFACARKIEPCPTILSPHSSSQQNKSTVGTPGRESCATPCTATSVKPAVELTPLRTPLGNARVDVASPTVLDACDIVPTTLCFPTDAESAEPNPNQHESRSAKIGSIEPSPNLHETRSTKIGSIEPNPNQHETRSAEIGSPSVEGTTRTVASQGSDCHQDLKTSDKETPSVVMETDFSCSPVLFTTPCPSPSASPITTAKDKVDCGQQGVRSEKKTDESSLGEKEHGGNNFNTFESLKATFLSQERVESENKGMVQKDDDLGKEPIGASEKSNRVIEVTGGPTMRKLFKSRSAAVNGPNREEHGDETADCLIGSDKPRDDVKENISSEKSKRPVCVQTTVTEKCLPERNSDENEQESAVDLSSRLRSKPAVKSESVARTNVRRSQRKNTRMKRSSRGDGQATQHREDVHEKVDERSIGNVPHCLQCESDLYSGHVTPEPITRSLRDTLRSSLVPTLDERSVLRADKTTSGTFNLCPLVDLNSERSSSGLKLNSLYISETECCYIPQVCRMCSTNGDPAQVVGVEVISFKATSEQESHQPLCAKQVWLFQHMVSCSKRD